MSRTGASRPGPAPPAGVAGVRRILANAVSLFLAYLLPRILTVGAVIVAARALGISGFGVYGTAAAFAVILSIAATLGMTPLLIREMAREPHAAAAWLRAAHLVKAGSSAVMLGLLLGLGHFGLRYPPDVLAAATLLGIAYAVGAWAENLGAWYQSVERMEVWMQANAWYGLVTGVLGALLVVSTRSVVWFCAAPIAGQVAALGWLVVRAPAGLRLGEAAAGGMVGRLLGSLVPFAAAFIAITAHSKVDVLLLAHWWPADEVGVYTAAHKFIDVMQALAIVAAGAVYPRLSRAGPAAAAGRLLELTLLAGVAAGGALWLAQETAVDLLFGGAYAAAYGPTALLALAIPALVVNIVAGYVLAAAGAMGRVAQLYGAALALKIGLNAWLVPGRGALGTAEAMLATEITLAAAMFVLLRTRAASSPRPRAVAAAALVAAVAALLAGAGAPDGLPLAAGFVTAAWLVYAGTGAISSADRQLLVAAMRRAPRSEP